MYARLVANSDELYIHLKLAFYVNTRSLTQGLGERGDIRG